MKLRGRVLDAKTKAPIVECIVTVTGLGGTAVLTNAHGVFEVGDLASGWTYELKFEHSGYHPTTVGGITGADREFELEPRQRKDGER